MKFFFVCGTHSNERLFAEPVARKLVYKHSELFDPNVSFVSIPHEPAERKRIGVVDGWTDYSDRSAASVYAFLSKEHGFDPKNPEHVVLDVHENPLNWKEVYSEHSDFYEEHVEPHIVQSRKDAQYGIYAASVHQLADYGDIRKMVRFPLSELHAHFAKPGRRAKFFRIELPVVGRLDDSGQVVADQRPTLKHFGSRSLDMACETIARLIMDKLHGTKVEEAASE